MGAPKGHKKYPGAGRAKGTPNKRNQNVGERCERLGVDVFEVLILTAGNQLECGMCRGAGKTEYQPGGGSKLTVRRCQSCWGRGLERISPKERAWAAGEVAQYLEAKLKATEHSFATGTGETLAAILTARRDRLAKEASSV